MSGRQSHESARRSSRSLSEGRVAGISRMTAVDTVRARVMLAVSLELLVAGDRLPAVDEMAEAFDVSRSSVIRGLTVLQEEGVIVRRSGRYGGSFVSSERPQSSASQVQAYLDDHATVHALIDERAVLEAGFGALAARERSETQLARMGELVEAMATTDNWAEFRNLDRTFHNVVAEAASVPLALPLLHRVNKALDPYFIPYSIELLRGSNDEHAQILDAITEGAADRAAELSAGHVQVLHRSMYVGLPTNVET